MATCLDTLERLWAKRNVEPKCLPNLLKKFRGAVGVEAKLQCIEKSKGYDGSDMIVIDHLQKTSFDRKHRNKVVI